MEDYNYDPGLSAEEIFETLSNSEKMLAKLRQQILRGMAHSQREIDTLIRQIVEIYPDTSGFFTTVTDGTSKIRLPFHICPHPLKFPLSVSTDVPRTKRRREGSIVRERIARGFQRHNGVKYRLKRVEPDGRIHVAYGTYFDALDSCDYLQDRIFSWWGSLDPWLQRQYLKRSSVVQEWVKNIRAILTNDFSGYHAVMGFTLAWIREREDGSCELLTTTGSRKKATGFGERHLCPAGMFEPCFDENQTRSEISFDDMRYYIAKEAIEEVHNNEEMEKNRFTFTSLKGAIARWRSERRSAGRDATLIDAILESDSLQFLGLAVDAFRLRPELLFVVRTRYANDFEPNWESDGIESRRFKPGPEYLAELRNSKEWVPPGLACTLAAVQSLTGSTRPGDR